MTPVAIDRNIRPEVHDIGPLTLEPDTEEVLPNGITLHTVNSGTAEVCRIGIALPGGVAESPKAEVYRVVSDLLPEGTISTPGAMLAEALETNGAWTQFGVNTHHTMLNLYCLNSRFDRLLPLLREMVFSPAFLPDATDRALRTLGSQLAVSRHKVDYVAARALRKTIYGEESPLAVDPAPEDIMEISPADLHQAHDVRLDPKRMHVYLSGHVTESMRRQVAETLGGSVPERDFEPLRLEFPVISESSEIVTELPEALQNSVKIAIPTPGRMHPDFIAMRFAACALGGYFGSRLMMNIREEKGLTYGINASLYGYPENGFLRVDTQTACANTRLVIDEVRNEIERLKDPASFTPDEVERLSRYLLSSLAATLDSPFSRMDFHQNTVLAGTPPDYFALQHKTVRELSAELLARAAEYFDTQLMTVSIAGKV